MLLVLRESNRSNDGCVSQGCGWNCPSIERWQLRFGALRTRPATPSHLSCVRTGESQCLYEPLNTLRPRAQRQVPSFQFPTATTTTTTCNRLFFNDQGCPGQGRAPFRAQVVPGAKHTNNKIMKQARTEQTAKGSLMRPQHTSGTILKPKSEK